MSKGNHNRTYMYVHLYTFMAVQCKSCNYVCTLTRMVFIMILTVIHFLLQVFTLRVIIPTGTWQNSSARITAQLFEGQNAMEVAT